MLVVVAAFCAGALSVVLAFRAGGRHRAARAHLLVPPAGGTLRDRRAFLEDLKLETARTDRTGRPTCLLIARLAPSPQSTATADAQAEALGRALAATLRTIDLRYRTGVNEFAVLMPETRAEGALVAIARVARALDPSGLSLYGGVAESGPGVDHDTLFRHGYCALLAASRRTPLGVLMYSLELEPPNGAAEPSARQPAESST